MLEYDFSALNYKEFMLLTWAVRKRMLCDKAREKLVACREREKNVAMAKRFPGGGVCFDACNSMGLKKSNRVVEKSGNTGAPIMLEVDDAQKLFLPWSERFEKINVVTKLPQDMKEAKFVSWMSKFILNMGMKMIQIVEILFY